MKLSIYSGRSSSAGYKSASALGGILGMPAFWLPDPGRLEDAIAGTIRAAAKAGRLGNDTLTIALDDSEPCSHGIEGIFGMKFADALRASGQQIMLTVEFCLEGERLMFGEYNLSLG